MTEQGLPEYFYETPEEEPTRLETWRMIAIRALTRVSAVAADVFPDADRDARRVPRERLDAHSAGIDPHTVGFDAPATDPLPSVLPEAPAVERPSSRSFDPRAIWAVVVLAAGTIAVRARRVWWRLRPWIRPTLVKLEAIAVALLTFTAWIIRLFASVSARSWRAIILPIWRSGILRLLRKVVHGMALSWLRLEAKRPDVYATAQRLLGFVLKAVAAVAILTLAIRFGLKALGADVGAPLVEFLYGLTAPTVDLFDGIFTPIVLDGESVIEFSTVLAFGVLVFVLAMAAGLAGSISQLGSSRARLAERVTHLTDKIALLAGLAGMALLGFSLVFRLLDVDLSAPFAGLVMAFSNPLVAPFEGMFETQLIEGVGGLDLSTVAALISYLAVVLIGGYVVHMIVRIVVGGTPQQVRPTLRRVSASRRYRSA